MKPWTRRGSTRSSRCWRGRARRGRSWAIRSRRTRSRSTSWSRTRRLTTDDPVDAARVRGGPVALVQVVVVEQHELAVDPRIAVLAQHQLTRAQEPAALVAQEIDAREHAVAQHLHPLARAEAHP